VRHLIAVLVVVTIVPTFAFAVVQPPREAFQQDPGLQARWEQMRDKLVDMEFKPQPKLSGPGTASYDVITHNLGKTDEQYARDSGIAPDSGEARLHDLNYDGMIDQFDLLELGYEVRPDNKGTSTAPSKGVNKILIFRSDFSDQDADYSTFDVDYMNNKFFDANASPWPSFHDYYWGVSYNQLDIEGTVEDHGPEPDGWYKGSQTRNYYRDTAGGDRILIGEAVANADPFVDFSDYDVDGDGYVDCFMIFYPNTEFSGNLWPHRSSGLNIHVDGVIIDAFFISGLNNNANDMTIACHEYGHILGLPDLYDVGGSVGPASNGIGYWSLMAYQYDGTQHCPSPDPWCKIQLGWLQPEVITHNVTGKELDYIEDNPQVLKVWRNGKEEDQYFLIANYKKTGTDSTRPGEGLLIEHIDETMNGSDQDNANVYRKHVDVVSARGWKSGGGTATALDHIDATDLGASGDLWRSGTQTTLNDTYATTCDAMKNNYSSAPTPSEISVTNISASGDTMTMDINVETANRPSCTITSPNDGDPVSGNQTVNVTAAPASGRTLSGVDFYCNGAYLGSDTSSPYSLTFDSRCIYDGTRVIKAVAVDNADSSLIDSDEINVDISNTGVTYPYSDDFASSAGAWASYNYTGTPASGSPTYRRWMHFPGSVGSRTNTAGIGSTSNGYGYSEHDEFVSIKVDLTGAVAPLARWKQYFRVASGENTVNVYVTADEGATFTKLYTGTGSALTWVPNSVDLSEYAGQDIRLVFRLDGSTLSRIGSGTGGWWIDDFTVKDISAPPQVLTIDPDDGSNITGTQTITVTASDDEGVAAVEFWIDGTDRLWIDNTSPYTFNWNSDWVFNGAHTFTAKALDDDQQYGQASVDWTTTNSGTAVPWSEGWSATYGTGWRNIDNGGGATFFWANNIGYPSGGGMKFGKSSGNYDDNELDTFTSPTFDLGTLDDPVITFAEKHDFETNYDFARLYVTTDLNTWTELSNWTGNGPTAWAYVGFRLDDYVGQKIKLRWQGESDTGVVRQGWWVDDFNIFSAPQITAVTPSRVPRGTTPSITVDGTGFGDNSAIEASSLIFDGTAVATTSWDAAGTQIKSTLPAGASSGNIVVKRRGFTSDPYWLQVILDAPTEGGLTQK
jgi:immune inhibitor A